jgi:hypothetical protein
MRVAEKLDWKGLTESQILPGGDEPGDAGDVALHSVRVRSVNIRTWRSTPHLPAGKGLANMPSSSPEPFPTVPTHTHTCGHCVFLPRDLTTSNLLRS